MTVDRKLEMIAQLMNAGILTADAAYDIFISDADMSEIDYPELKLETIEMSLP